MLLPASRGPNCVTAQGDCDREFFLPRVSLNVGARCLRSALCCASCQTTEMCVLRVIALIHGSGANRVCSTRG